MRRERERERSVLDTSILTQALWMARGRFQIPIGFHMLRTRENAHYGLPDQQGMESTGDSIARLTSIFRCE